MKLIGTFHYATHGGFYLEIPDGRVIEVEMPPDTYIEDIPLETLVEVELDENRVLSWK